MDHAADFRSLRIPLLDRAGEIPAVGFGTLIAEPALTLSATRDALEAGYRHFDCAERYGNECEIGEALRDAFAAGGVSRCDLFMTTKLWNTNHRPERVERAFNGSRNRLGLDELDLYLMHTPFAFQSGDDPDPRNDAGDILYDEGVTLLETWQAMERLVIAGKCRAIGISDIGLEQLDPLYEAATIKPAVIQVEAHPYLPQTEMLDYCRARGMVLLAFAPLGHGIRPGPIEDPTVQSVASEIGRTPAQVLLSWAVQRGTAMLTTPKSPDRARENLDIASLPAEAFEAINGIETRQRFNGVVETGSPGFIPRGH
jgi:aldehyde reductase